MNEDGLTADHDLILRGVRDALDNRPTKYPEDEMELAIRLIESAVRQRKAEKQYAADASFRKIADENLRNSREAFARAAAMDGVETLPSGLLLRVLKPGDGRFVATSPVLKANFTVSLADKTIVRSSEPDEPATVRVARLPSALAEALQEMRVGCKCQIALPPEKAFGLGGLPPVIGPNQALLVEFEIVEVQ
jgi:FKBP-type peptidyl-prolyl cis-trans isomerase FklB